jgi:hypothetical protein
MEKLELTYSVGSASRKELQDEVNSLLRESSSEGPSVLDSITVEEAAQGVDPIVTPIVITIVATVGSEMALDAWHALLGKVKAKLGQDAIGRQQKDD